MRARVDPSTDRPSAIDFKRYEMHDYNVHKCEEPDYMCATLYDGECTMYVRSCGRAVVNLCCGVRRLPSRMNDAGRIYGTPAITFPATFQLNAGCARFCL